MLLPQHNQTGIFQRYVVAPDRAPATAICIARSGASYPARRRTLQITPSACSPDLQVPLILTTIRRCPGRPPGLFLVGSPQCARPLLISSCQRLITPGGNSRSPAPTRRQASGHISSKTWSRRNSSLCETSPASELGHWSAAIRNSSISGGMYLSLAIYASPSLFLDC